MSAINNCQFCISVRIGHVQSLDSSALFTAVTFSKKLPLIITWCQNLITRVDEGIPLRNRNSMSHYQVSIRLIASVDWLTTMSIPRDLYSFSSYYHYFPLVVIITFCLGVIDSVDFWLYPVRLSICS